MYPKRSTHFQILPAAASNLAESNALHICSGALQAVPPLPQWCIQPPEFVTLVGQEIRTSAAKKPGRRTASLNWNMLKSGFRMQMYDCPIKDREGESAFPSFSGLRTRKHLEEIPICLSHAILYPVLWIWRKDEDQEPIPKQSPHLPIPMSHSCPSQGYENWSICHGMTFILWTWPSNTINRRRYIYWIIRHDCPNIS